MEKIFLGNYYRYCNKIIFIIQYLGEIVTPFIILSRKSNSIIC